MVYGRQEGGKWGGEAEEVEEVEEEAGVCRWRGEEAEEEVGWRWRARCCWLQATTGHPAPGQLKPGAAASQRKHFDSILGSLSFPSPQLSPFLHWFLAAPYHWSDFVRLQLSFVYLERIPFVASAQSIFGKFIDDQYMGPFQIIGEINIEVLYKKTSQELRMLSSVTLNCQVKKIVMNLGSQL